MKHITHNNHIDLIKNGPEFITTNLKLINEARSFIFFHTYIFEEDNITQPLIDAFIQKAQQGVAVYILLDAFGSEDLSHVTKDRFQDAGVNFHFFTPLFHINNIGRRLHQKVLLIDNKKCLLGGINYSKKFNSPEQKTPWLDYSCVVEGEEVYNTFQTILKLYLKNFPKHKEQLLSFRNYSHTVEDYHLIKTNENDWTRHKQQIYNSYLIAIKSAKHEIIILATYFIPGKKLLKYLRKAQKRGVRIKLIFGKISDHPLVSAASDYFYQWYLDNHFEIYEWDQSVIHGKLALIDNKWVSIGSYNHNYISRYGNLEINYEIISKEFSQTVAHEFESIVSSSKKLTYEDLNRGMRSRVFILIVYFLTNIITFFSILFIFKRDEEEENFLK
ncbi:MAG: phospholipase D-like domain-containing protein [Bacteriovoracaceae bacterium]|jgi:cardiolipin synthase|nr:hypothetical protein [Halobacteriovoraceae bacterium]MDP7320629.1 phospholipase D-like domain-containing protein [Bacteriovoracaceae bacterium]